MEATYHTYSSPGSLSSYQLKGLQRMGRGGSLAFSPTSTSLPAAQRPRSLRGEESQDANVCSHDQYVQMAGVRSLRAASHSSCPTLHRAAPPSSLSECGSMKLGFSYEVPVPFHLEPEYASIPSPYVPYLVPVQSNNKQGMSDTHVHRQHSDQSHREMYIGREGEVPQLHQDHTQPSLSAPASPISLHDYEELIHTSTNKAYREMKVTEDRNSDCYTSLVPLPHSASADYTILLHDHH